MRLLYDNLVYYLQVNGGISTYWYELTSRLMRDEQILLSFYEPARKTANMLRKKLDISPAQILPSPFDFPIIERMTKLPLYPKDNIFHSSYFRVPVKSANTKVVTTIHDCTHEKYYSGTRSWFHQHFKSKAIKASDYIIAVSQHTKNDLLYFYPEIKETNVSVIYHGASSDYKVETTNQHQLDPPFFLFVGSREHYKNFDFAVNLTAACKGFHLYIVGQPLSVVEQRMVTQALGNRYRSFQQISNATLNQLYNAAFCLLYPSFNEGFGIPLLEAMQAGCPFVAINASSIPEVAGNAGVLLNSLNMGEGLAAIAYIEGQRTALVEQGLRQVQKFSWDSCFQDTYHLYQTVTS